MARRWRVHHAMPDSPEPGASIDLVPGEAHHVRRVLRLRAGEQLAVFDGAGREWSARIARSDADGVSLVIVEELHSNIEPPLEVSLFQSSARNDKIDWVVQKGTEIGLFEIVVVETARSEVGAPTEKKLERWRRIALESCKQCGRTRVPTVGTASGVPAPAEATLALLLDVGDVGEGGEGVEALERPLRGSAPERVWLAVGPEGGFEPGEVSAWVAAGWRRAGLGPRILRTETAGLVAASIVLHGWADLGRDPAAPRP